MNIEILICSYEGDIQYLHGCLKSIRKFSKGFKAVRLLVAKEEVPLFLPISTMYGTELSFYDRDPNPVKWHIHHQAMKCCADRFSDASFFFHVDSDCLFTEPFTPDDYFVDGKPVILISRYSDIPDHVPWKEVMKNILKRKIEYETMQRHPAVHYSGLYSCARATVEKLHKKEFVQFVLDQKPDYPWGFTEFNLLGNIAIVPPWKDKYHIIISPPETRPKDKLMQFWSRTDIYTPMVDYDGRKISFDEACNIFQV